MPTGSTLLKQRQLGQLGYKVVSVPCWEWVALRRDRDQEQAYLFRALAGCVPPQAPRKEKREAEKEVVPKNEADEEDKDALLDERLTSVDWDDDAALKKLTNEVLKQYRKKHNLRSSGLNKARAQFCSALLVRLKRITSLDLQARLDASVQVPPVMHEQMNFCIQAGLIERVKNHRNVT